MEIDVTKRINPIARVVIVKDNHILLTSATKENDRFDSNLHFLPGGHVEHTESAQSAIVREMSEELYNVNLEVTNFLGVLECVWDNKGQPYHELNIVFKGEFDGENIDTPPISKEPHIKYEWFGLDELKKVNLLPKSFENLIPLWLNANVDNNLLLATEM